MALPTILSNSELLSATLESAKIERQATSQVLLYLQEIEARKLFLTEGFPSLYEFTVKVLAYSEPAAYRRIAAMRLLKQIPDLKDSLDSGELNLSQLSSAQTFFKKQSQAGRTSTVKEKSELVHSLAGKSTRECEKIFLAISPEHRSADRIKEISDQEPELRFTVREEFMNKLNRYRELNSHTLKELNLAEIFEHLLTSHLQKQESKLKGVNNADKEDSVLLVPSSSQTPAPESHRMQKAITSEKVPLKDTRTIPISVKRTVWMRDQGQCQFRNQQTGQVCGSRFQVQYDHVTPYAMGGNHDPENLRLRCKSHNLHAAQNFYGTEKMGAFVLKEKDAKI